MKTKLLAYITGVTTFLGWFVTMTPEQQTSVFAPIIAVIPVTWQANVGVALKMIGAISGTYMIIRLRNNQTPKP